MNDDRQSPEHAEVVVEPNDWVPRYGLRALLGLVALMAVLFAVARTYGYTWGIVLGWFVVLGAVHVAANAWGARRRHAEMLSAAIHNDDPRDRSAQTHNYVPAHSGGESIMRCDDRQGMLAGGVAVVVAIVAGVLVAVLLAVLCGDRCGPSGIILGGVSAAVIGGLTAFAATAFFETATRAWAEAISADSPGGEKRA